MEKIIAKQVKLYVDDLFDPVWSYLKTRFGTGAVSSLKKKTHHVNADSNYRDDYRKRILRTKPFPVYPYLSSSKIVLSEQKRATAKAKIKNLEKLIYLAGWETMTTITIPPEANLVLHLQNLPEYEPKISSYKATFEQATYIFVATFELKEFIMTTFDINPYKIIVLKINLDQNLNKPKRLSNQKHLFILGDLFKGKISLEQVIKSFSGPYKLIFVTDLQRLKKIMSVVHQGIFLDRIGAEMWHKIHADGNVYILNLNTTELKPCLFEDFQILNLNFMYENLVYYLSQMVE